jgi:hypothetical protein
MHEVLRQNPAASVARIRAHGRAFAHIATFHPELTALRRDLHAHPELGFEEIYTARRVVDALKVCGVDEIQTLAVSGHGTAATSDGGSLDISGGFGSLKVGQTCAGAALGEGNLGGAYGWAHAIKSTAAATADCTANWQYGLPTMVKGLTVAARISQTAGGISVEGFSAAENSAQLRLGYASGPMSVSYFFRSTTGEVHASYNLGFAQVKFGMDTKTATGTNERTEFGVSAPMGPVTLAVGYGKQADTKKTGLQLGATYALSKRTAIDGVYGSFKNATVDNAFRVRLLHSF